MSLALGLPKAFRTRNAALFGGLFIALILTLMVVGAQRAISNSDWTVLAAPRFGLEQTDAVVVHEEHGVVVIAVSLPVEVPAIVPVQIEPSLMMPPLAFH